MSKPTISLCMIVKNEEKQLPRCLSSVQGAVDEIIVVDTGSTDGTREIARRFGAKVCRVEWNGDFAFARNVGLLQAKGTWILFLDADEELEQSHAQELGAYAEHLELDGLFLQIHNHNGDHRDSPTATINPILRMFRNRPEYRFNGKIHEQIAESIVSAKPDASFHITSICIHHYGYSGEEVARKNKIERNAGLLREQLEQEPNNPFPHYNMAVEYMRMNRFEDATAHIRRALDLCAPETSYRHLLFKYGARCLLLLKRYEEAAAMCSQGLEECPEYTDLVHLSGVIHLAAGHKPEALMALIQAIRMGAPPEHYHTESGMGTYLSCLALGQLFEITDDDGAAIHWYAEAVRHHAPLTMPLQRIFRLFAAGGGAHEIADFMTKKFDMKSPAVRMKVLRLLVGERCYEAALSLLARLREEKQEEPGEEAQRFLADTELRCTAWTGKAALAEQTLLRAGRDSIQAAECMKLAAWLRWIRAEPDDAGEAELDGADFAVTAAYLNGAKQKALRLLGQWLASSGAEASEGGVPSAAGPSREAYRKSRALLALAEAKLEAGASAGSPSFPFYRKARQSLPLSRIQVKE